MTLQNKPKGFIRIENESQRKRRFAKSLAAQSLLQAMTFCAGVYGYHTVVMPQCLLETFQNAHQLGEVKGWNDAVVKLQITRGK